MVALISMIRWQLLEKWSAEKAWFTGVLYGDGNVFRGDRYSRVSVCKSYSLAYRWIQLIYPGREPQELKLSPGTYQAYVDSVDLVSWFEREMGICGPKSDSLEWPEGMPTELDVHFIRGLWDTDGSLGIERRRRKRARGNDAPLASLSMNAGDLVRTVRSRLEANVEVGRVAITRDKRVRGIGYSGSPAMKVANWLYANAPEHLRNEDRFKKYQEMCSLWESIRGALCECGEPARKEGLCARCWYKRRGSKTGKGTVCSCGNSPVLAKGMCSACYNRERRAKASYRRAANGTCACGKTAYRRGMCDKCYSADYRRRKKEAAAQTPA